MGNAVGSVPKPVSHGPFSFALFVGAEASTEAARACGRTHCSGELHRLELLSDLSQICSKELCIIGIAYADTLLLYRRKERLKIKGVSCLPVQEFLLNLKPHKLLWE